MGLALVSSWGTTAVTTGTRNIAPGVNAGLSDDATEANRQVPVRIPGTFSFLQVLADNVGTARSVTFRKNGAAGNLTVSPTNTTAGLYTDTTHTDVVAAGDLCDLRLVNTGTPLLAPISMLFRGTAAHATLFNAVGPANLSTASLQVCYSFAGLTTSAVTTANEAQAQHKNRAGAIDIVNYYAFVSANARTTSSVYGIRVNGVDGANRVTVGAGLTGLFEDTAHTDSIVDGDLVAHTLTNGTGVGTITFQQLGCGLKATAGQVKNDVAAFLVNGLSRAAGAAQTFHAIAGSLSTAVAEANAKVQHGFVGAATNARVFVSANTYTGTATFLVRKNGANGNQTVAIGAGLTGIFEDTTHTDFFLPADDICFAISDGTANSMTIRSVGLTETDLTPNMAQLASQPAAPQRRTSSQGTMTPVNDQPIVVVLPVMAYAVAQQGIPLKKVAQEADTALQDAGVFTPRAWASPMVTPPLHTAAQRVDIAYQDWPFTPLPWGASAKTPPLGNVRQAAETPMQDWPFTALAWSSYSKTPPLKTSALRWDMPALPEENFFPQTWPSALQTPPLKRVAAGATFPWQDWPFVALSWGFALVTPPLKRTAVRIDIAYQDWPFTALAWSATMVSTRRTSASIGALWPMREPDLIIVLDVMAWAVSQQTTKARTPTSIRIDVSRETPFVPLAWQAGLVSRLGLRSAMVAMMPSRVPDRDVTLASMVSQQTTRPRTRPLLLGSTAVFVPGLPPSQAGPHAPLLRNRHSGKARVYWKGST